MIEAITGLGYGIIAFAVVIGIGIVILGTLGTNISACPTGYGYNTNGTDIVTTNVCCKTNAVGCTGVNQTGASQATQGVNTLSGYLGTSSGGLATWIPIIIVLTIGILFLGIFLARKSTKN